MEKKTIIKKILEEINYTPTRYGGRYNFISIPNLVELTVGRTIDYLSNPEENVSDPNFSKDIFGASGDSRGFNLDNLVDDNKCYEEHPHTEQDEK